MNNLDKRLLQMSLESIVKMLLSSGEDEDAALASMILGAGGCWLAGDAVSAMKECVPIWERQIEQIERIKAAPNN